MVEITSVLNCIDELISVRENNEVDINPFPVKVPSHWLIVDTNSDE